VAGWYTQIHTHAAITSIEVFRQHCQEMSCMGTMVHYFQKVDDFETSGSKELQEPLGTNICCVVTEIVDHMLHANKLVVTSEAMAK
jgi:hypothetical protein